jgi:hypothetical protein
MPGSVLELPGQRLYEPKARVFDPYWKHYVDFEMIDGPQLVAEVRELSARSRSPVVVIAPTRLGARRIRHTPSFLGQFRRYRGHRPRELHVDEHRALLSRQTA